MIKFQLGVVPPQVSLVYRFALAALVLAAYAKWKGRRMTVSKQDLPMVAIQGFFMFSANYYFVYTGTAYVTTGLVAVLFTLLVFMNAINERLFFGTKITGTAVIAGLGALAGVGMMFWPEIRVLTLQDDTVKGIALIICGALMASFGNMAAIRNTRRRLPVVAVNMLGMAFGTLCSLIFAIATGQAFIMEWTFSYVSSLVFLAIPGTAVAFGLYLMLLERIGGAKAAYTAVMLPVIALLISTAFEGYRWSTLAVLGLFIAIVGNALALMEKTSPETRNDA